MLLVFCLSCASVTEPGPDTKPSDPVPLPDAVLAVANRTVLLERGCTGVLLGHMRIATAAHCIEENVLPRFITWDDANEFPDGANIWEVAKWRDAYLIAANGQSDVALLGIVGKFKDVAPVEFENPAGNVFVFVMGHPNLALWTLTSGYIVSVHKGKADGFLRENSFAMTARVAPGSSGSGVWTVDGQLVGIVHSIHVTFYWGSSWETIPRDY